MPELITRREALRRVGFMLGAAVSAPVLSGVLGGCRAEHDPGYAVRALSGGQYEQVAVMSDHIIPPTDTPGARGAGVPEFIDKMLADWLPDEDRQRFLRGLDEVDARTEAEHGTRFLDLDAQQQFALLAVLDEEAYAPAPPPAEDPLSEDAIASAQQGSDLVRRREQEEVGGESLVEDPADEPAEPAAPPFFRQLKELTLAGYYTSRVGMTQELLWLASPGRYDGDIPLEQVGRAWA